MSQLNEKTTSIIYRSLVEAAERFYEKDPATALEIYRSFCRYAFCLTEDVETDNEIAEIIVRQNIESLNAADRRYAAAVNNGDKGKEYGVMGKEYGKLGGRPRKNETREEYWERKRREQETGEKEPYTPPVDEKKERAHNLARNYKKDDEKDGRGESTLTTGWIKNNIFSGQKCVYCGEEDWHKLGCDRIDNTKPHTPDNVVCSCSKCNVERGSMTYEEFKEKKGIPPKNPPLSGDKETPLTSALASSSTSTTTISSSLSKTNSSSISETNSLGKDAESYFKDFLSNPTKDYSCLLNNVSYFINRNNSDLLDLQENLKKKCNCDYTLNDIISSLQFLYKGKINYKVNE